MTRVLVVILSYILVYGIESTPYTEDTYYFWLCATCFVLTLICAKTNDDYLHVYAAMQIILMALYMFTMGSLVDLAAGVLYSPTFNYSIMVQAYELFILSTGLANVAFISYNWVINADNRSNSNRKGNFEART